MTARAACPEARQMPSSATCHPTCSSGSNDQRRIAPAQVPLLALTARGMHPHSRRHMRSTSTTADIRLTRHRKLAIAIRRRASPQVVGSTIHGPHCSPPRHGESADRSPCRGRGRPSSSKPIKESKGPARVPKQPKPSNTECSFVSTWLPQAVKDLGKAE